MDRDRLKQLIEGCVAEGEVTLASGKKSDFYVDGRLVTLSCAGSHLVGQAVLEVARELNVTAIGGPTTGACPMVSAAGVLADQAEVPLKLFYVRAAPKGHGMQKTIEGATLTAQDRCLIVDDVMTSGGSILRAVENIKAETDAQVVGAFCLVDREADGRENLEAAGVMFRSLYTRTDLKR